MKKVKLDLWEDIPEIEERMDEQGQVSDAPEAVSGEGFFSKWATRKLFVLIMPVGLVLLLAVSATIFLLKRTITQRQVARIQIQKPQETIRAEQLHKNATVEEAPATGIKQALPEKTEILHFTDFMIDLKDAQGKSHVLFCDLAFEIAGTGQNERAEKITLIRGAIIKAAQARSVVALRSVEERKKLKKDFATALDGILGDGSVRDVYFTNYLII